MRILVTGMVSSLFMCAVCNANAATLTIESWRSDDVDIWREKLIPAFEAKNPDIKIDFAPTRPAEYTTTLNSKLDAGSAGDIITCRPFDASLELFNKKQLVDLTSLSGMENFSPVAKAAWSTDDGKSTFCVPMASVIHGFIYNKDAFDRLGIAVPKTEEEFISALVRIKADDTYIPMAMGTKDQWEAATMGYQNIGPNYWKGEDGREALISGKQKLTDADWVKPLEELAKWTAFLGNGFEYQTYSDSQNLFTLGRAAIYPAGSWEISLFNSQAQFKMGAFPPPVPKAGDTCYISDHPDIGVGLNAKSTHQEEAKKFLTWVASPEFADIYANSLPGFFSLNSNPVKMSDPLAQEFVSWREMCKPTIRSTYQILSRGTPSLETETWAAAANVINGKQTPEEAAAKLQAALGGWFKPVIVQQPSTARSSACLTSFGEASVPSAFAFGPNVMKSYADNASIPGIIRRIVLTTGLAPRFAAYPAKIGTACASRDADLQPVIYYDEDWLKDYSKGDYWIQLGVLAHEIGHLVNGHGTGDGLNQYQREIEADVFLGRVVALISGTIQEAELGVSLQPEEGTATHPPRFVRRASVDQGYRGTNQQ